MSDTDLAFEAVERLEHTDLQSRPRIPGFDRRAFLRRTALTGAAVASVSTLLEACGSSASSSSSGDFEQCLRLPPDLQIRRRQPRHDQLLLRPHPVRHRRRLQTARLLVRVDGLGKQQRQPDDQLDQHRGDQRSGRDRGRADRSARLQRSRRSGAEGRYSGRRLQRRRPHQQAPLLHRPGPETRRRKDGRTDRRRRRLGRRRAVHRDARLGEPRSRASKARSRRSRPPASRSRRTKSPPAPPNRASSRRSKPIGSGTRKPRACTPSTAAAPRSSRKSCRSSGWPPKASRPAASTSPKSPRSCCRKATSNSRSTSSPTCRASCRSCSCSSGWSPAR